MNVIDPDSVCVSSSSSRSQDGAGSGSGSGSNSSSQLKKSSLSSSSLSSPNSEAVSAAGSQRQPPKNVFKSSSSVSSLPPQEDLLSDSSAPAATATATATHASESAAQIDTSKTDPRVAAAIRRSYSDGPSGLFIEQRNSGKPVKPLPLSATRKIPLPHLSFINMRSKKSFSSISISSFTSNSSGNNNSLSAGASATSPPPPQQQQQQQPKAILRRTGSGMVSFLQPALHEEGEGGGGNTMKSLTSTLWQCQHCAYLNADLFNPLCALCGMDSSLKPSRTDAADLYPGSRREFQLQLLQQQKRQASREYPDSGPVWSSESEPTLRRDRNDDTDIIATERQRSFMSLNQVSSLSSTSLSGSPRRVPPNRSQSAGPPPATLTYYAAGYTPTVDYLDDGQARVIPVNPFDVYSRESASSLSSHSSFQPSAIHRLFQQQQYPPVVQQHPMLAPQTFPPEEMTSPMNQAQSQQRHQDPNSFLFDALAPPSTAYHGQQPLHNQRILSSSASQPSISRVDPRIGDARPSIRRHRSYDECYLATASAQYHHPADIQVAATELVAQQPGFPSTSSSPSHLSSADASTSSPSPDTRSFDMDTTDHSLATHKQSNIYRAKSAPVQPQVLQPSQQTQFHIPASMMTNSMPPRGAGGEDGRGAGAMGQVAPASLPPAVNLVHQQQLREMQLRLRQQQQQYSGGLPGTPQKAAVPARSTLDDIYVPAYLPSDATPHKTAVPTRETSNPSVAPTSLDKTTRITTANTAATTTKTIRPQIFKRRSDKTRSYLPSSITTMKEVISVTPPDISPIRPLASINSDALKTDMQDLHFNLEEDVKASASVAIPAPPSPKPPPPPPPSSPSLALHLQRHSSNRSTTTSTTGSMTAQQLSQTEESMNQSFVSLQSSSGASATNSQVFQTHDFTSSSKMNMSNKSKRTKKVKEDKVVEENSADIDDAEIGTDPMFNSPTAWDDIPSNDTIDHERSSKFFLSLMALIVLVGGFCLGLAIPLSSRNNSNASDAQFQPPSISTIVPRPNSHSGFAATQTPTTTGPPLLQTYAPHRDGSNVPGEAATSGPTAQATFESSTRVSPSFFPTQSLTTQATVPPSTSPTSSTSTRPTPSPSTIATGAPAAPKPDRTFRGWSRLGRIEGNLTGEFLGGHVASNFDGSVVSVASTTEVRIYAVASDGPGDILGKAIQLSDPMAVSINYVGDVVAVASKDGSIKVFRFDKSASEWQQFGHDVPLSGDNSPCASISIALSADGMTIATGVLRSSNTATIQVFEYNMILDAWRTVGQGLEQAGTFNFVDVDLSWDGSIVAASRHNDSSYGVTVEVFKRSSLASPSRQVWTTQYDEWQRLGQRLSYRRSAVAHISLSANGSALAVATSSKTRVYRFLDSKDHWHLVGDAIAAGSTISLAAVTRVLITRGDQVALWEWDGSAWAFKGSVPGTTGMLSRNGLRLFVGNPWFDGNSQVDVGLLDMFETNVL